MEQTMYTIMGRMVKMKQAQDQQFSDYYRQAEKNRRSADSRKSIIKTDILEVVHAWEQYSQIEKKTGSIVWRAESSRALSADQSHCHNYKKSGHLARDGEEKPGKYCRDCHTTTYNTVHCWS